MSNRFRLVQASAATLATVLGVMVLSMVGNTLYSVSTPEQDGYRIAAAEAQAAETSAAAPAATAAITPDPAAGSKVFSKCKACHNVDPSVKNGTGPGLYGVVNRPIASVSGFNYSDGMKSKASDSWSPQKLDEFLSNVKGTVPGTKMAFSGLSNPAERAHLIAFLAQNSAAPVAPDQLGLGAATVAAATAPATAASDAPAEAAAPAVIYADPPAPSPEDEKKEADAVAALKAAMVKLDYERARHHPIHQKPLIDTATNGECLVCHQEVLDRQVRDISPAGVKTADSLAWYQTLATYDGTQMTFHQRHMSSPYAKAVMNLKCTFCHQGNDLREEAPQMSVAPADLTSNNGSVPFTLRKMVNPSETCLLCHGAMPDPQNIMGLPGPWPEARKDLESADAPNGCLTCHADAFRTNRHKVTYLNAATIEDLAKESSDVCYGCHGGRSWYMKSYPYPRHPWPGMDASTVPDWAQGRKADSDPRYVIKDAAQQ